MAGINMNRTTAGVLLRPEVSRDIWQEALEDSAVAALVPQTTMPGAGQEIQVITGEPEAEWVGETEEKPVGEHTFGLKTMKPYKMALIELFSDEFRRDKKALYQELVTRLPKSLGRLLDRTVLYGTAPGTGFDVLSDAPTLALRGPANIGDDILAVNAAIAAAGHRLSGWGLSPQAEAKLIGARDASGNLLFSQNFRDSIEVGRVLGRPVYVSKSLYKPAVVDDPATTGVDETAPALIGIAGDWNQARLGIVERIRVKYSDQATINKDGTQVNTWQRNMFAVLVEMELGFVVNDKAGFIRLTNGA